MHSNRSRGRSERANLVRLRDFIRDFTQLFPVVGTDEERIFREGRPMLQELLRHDDWLPDHFARADPDHYQQFLLYCDPLERFCLVSFVWGPGQSTHTFLGRREGGGGQETDGGFDGLLPIPRSQGQETYCIMGLDSGRNSGTGTMAWMFMYSTASVRLPVRLVPWSFPAS